MWNTIGLVVLGLVIIGIIVTSYKAIKKARKKKGDFTYKPLPEEQEEDGCSSFKGKLKVEK
jgi:hypothetical protein